MRFFSTLAVACLLAPAIAHPQLVTDIQRREAAQEAESIFAPVSDLWKRKGGGGGGGKGGGGGSGSTGGKGGGTSGGNSGSRPSRYVPLSNPHV